MAKAELDVRMRITIDDEMTARKFGKPAGKTKIRELKTFLVGELAELSVDVKDIHVLGVEIKQ